MISKILFICHGNICRSTTAEFVMKKHIDDNPKLKGKVYVESCATSNDEIGNPIYPESKEVLIKRGVPYDKSKVARKLLKEDYDKFDLLICMDEENIDGIKRIIKNDPQNKIHKLLEYTGVNDDIEDPWYTRNFDKVFDQIDRGCTGLEKALL